jgi:hypothetical protein
MKNFLMMILAGAIGAGITAIFPLKSLESTATAQAVQDAIRAGACTVKVGYQRPSPMGRCYRGEAMTGYINETIYCSEITVNCSDATPAN